MRLPSGILAVAFCWIMGALPLLGCDSSPDSAPKGTQEAAPTQSSPQPKKETPLEVDQLAAALHTLASEHQEAIAAADLQQLKSLQTQARSVREACETSSFPSIQQTTPPIDLWGWIEHSRIESHGRSGP